MIPRDTAREAHERQIEFYRGLAPAERVELLVRMSEDAREIAQAGIRARHPEYSGDEVRYAFLRHSLGADLFHKAWPTAPELAP